MAMRWRLSHRGPKARKGAAVVMLAGSPPWVQRRASAARSTAGAVSMEVPTRARACRRHGALADGRLYYRTEAGPVILVEPSPKGYLERGRFNQPGRSRASAWPHPVIANGRLYLRDQDVLLSYDVKGK